MFDLLCANPPLASHHWLWFCDSCRQRGVKNALASVPLSLRPEVKAALSTTEAPWWDVDAIWVKWPSVIDDLGLLDPVWKQ